MERLRIGIHTSTAGSLEKAALKAAELGANTFQIFSSSPRTWRASKPAPSEIVLLRRAREKFDLTPLVIHVNYLVNLASADAEVRAKSIASFRGELERAGAIGAEFLVLHPGNHRGQELGQGMAAFVDGFTQAAAGFGGGVTVLLENTVGAGAQIGSRFEELRVLRDLAQPQCDVPIGYCLDTCHLLASGFDIATAEGLAKTLEDAGRILGLDEVKVIHANDSKGALGSHLDRHENIGAGAIGEAGFTRILRHASLRAKPFILETPSDDGADRRDVDALKRLAVRGA
jgi:deoxyribonuclease-4